MSMKTVWSSALSSWNSRLGRKVTGLQSKVQAFSWPGKDGIGKEVTATDSETETPKLRYRNKTTKQLFPFGDGRHIQECSTSHTDNEKTEKEDPPDSGTYIYLDFEYLEQSQDPKKENEKEEEKQKGAEKKPENVATEPPSTSKTADSYFGVYRNTYIEPVIRTVGKVRDILPYIYPTEKAEKAETPVAEKPTKAKVTKRIPLAKDALYDRTFSMLLDVRRAESTSSLLQKLQELSRHLTKYPEATDVAVKHGMTRHVRWLLSRAQSTRSTALAQQCNLLLAVLGEAPPTRRRGIRILSIDGGGTRGLISIEILGEIERRCGRPIYKLFDYICGVSTGALIASMTGIFRVSPSQTEAIYRQFSREMFERNAFLGTGKLVISHAFYDADIWERILRNHIGEKLMVDTAKNPGAPKMGVVSCLMNGPVLKTFVFRSYNLPPGSRDLYTGSSHYKIWEAIRASSAAPGYFPEFKLNGNIHLDGGLHTNNPAAVALHESTCLWPDTPIQCVVSLGNGRYEPIEDEIVSEASLKTKLTRVVQSATDTEATHTCLQDLLPTGSYFRFNPYMSRDFPLDEIRPSQLEQIQKDTREYLSKNHWKLDACKNQLLGGPIDVPVFSKAKVKQFLGARQRNMAI